MAQSIGSCACASFLGFSIERLFEKVWEDSAGHLEPAEAAFGAAMTLAYVMVAMSLGGHRILA
jgi:hypothetical protein